VSADMAKRHADILLRFVGGDIKPEVVPSPILLAAIHAVQQLAFWADEAGTADEESRTERSLNLTGIVRASAGYQFTTAFVDEAVNHLRLVGQFLERPQEVEAMDVPIRAIETLSRTARLLGCTIIISKPSDDIETLATFSHDSFDRVSTAVFLTGETTITGRMIRVGGATALRCALRTTTQSRLVYAKVPSRELGRQLGRLLYSEVTVSGTATWIRTNWQIVDFIVKSVEGPKDHQYLRTLRAASDAGERAWSQIEDPDSFLAEVTGES
jgi:hypothetical protein